MRFSASMTYDLSSVKTQLESASAQLYPTTSPSPPGSAGKKREEKGHSGKLDSLLFSDRGARSRGLLAWVRALLAPRLVAAGILSAATAAAAAAAAGCVALLVKRTDAFLVAGVAFGIRVDGRIIAALLTGTEWRHQMVEAEVHKAITAAARAWGASALPAGSPIDAAPAYPDRAVGTVATIAVGFAVRWSSRRRRRLHWRRCLLRRGQTHWWRNHWWCLFRRRRSSSVVIESAKVGGLAAKGPWMILAVERGLGDTVLFRGLARSLDHLVRLRSCVVLCAALKKVAREERDVGARRTVHRRAKLDGSGIDVSMSEGGAGCSTSLESDARAGDEQLQREEDREDGQETGWKLLHRSRGVTVEA